MLEGFWTVGVIPIVLMGIAAWFASYQLYRYMPTSAARKAVITVLTVTTVAELSWALAYITLGPIYIYVAVVLCTVVGAVLASLSVGLAAVMSMNYLRVRSARWRGIRLIATGTAVSSSLVIEWLYLYRMFV